jgi:hypothetical protein
MFFHVVITYTKLPLRKFARCVNISQHFRSMNASTTEVRMDVNSAYFRAGNLYGREMTFHATQFTQEV